MTTHRLAKERGREVRILLVEDHPVNQKITLMFLQWAGYRVELAENGRQAVEAYKRKVYDLILMDIQMPEMDGYGVTREIRKLEDDDPQSTVKRVPIVAMTAHSWKRDREKCIEAGMDDYLTKPLREKELCAMVDKWSGRMDEAGNIRPTTTVDPQTLKTDSQYSMVNIQSKEVDPMNFEMALMDFKGDEPLLMEVLDDFRESVKTQIENTRRAISEGNVEEAGREARTIKGAAANLKAEVLSGIASELVNIAKSDNLEGAADALERFEKELCLLEAFIRDRSSSSRAAGF